jgi:rhamnose utilization protein RhaD (predicted bifunctional aldolase and dehydrogenase)
MYEEAVKDLEIISQAIGKFSDLVQGGGGNTSVKINEELMVIKASGYRLNQVTQKEGFVVVNYKDIKNYIINADLNSNIDFERESIDLFNKNIINLEGLKTLRPSVEAGFHSILQKYVIHSHSVYANILCCSNEGKQISEKIFSDKTYDILWIPYVKPGFFLTVKIYEDIQNHIERGGNFPKVILLENHGLIVSSENLEEVLQIHEDVNKSIKCYLNIDEKYPEIKLKAIGTNLYLSNTKFISAFLKENKISREFFEKIALYPDQIVYLNDNISINTYEDKINIDVDEKKVIYKASYEEAFTLEEVFLAYAYIISKIKENNLSIKTLTPEEIDFIRNWESEKYRKSLIGL